MTSDMQTDIEVGTTSPFSSYSRGTGNVNTGTAGVLACQVPPKYVEGTRQARTPAVPVLTFPVPRGDY